MELTEIIGMAAILVAFVALMWQMNSQSNRVRDELLEAIRENREAIRENREAIRENKDAIQSLDGRLSDVERDRIRADVLSERLSEAEREQARLEGANRMLSDIILQQSHTHEAD